MKKVLSFLMIIGMSGTVSAVRMGKISKNRAAVAATRDEMRALLGLGALGGFIAYNMTIRLLDKVDLVKSDSLSNVVFGAAVGGCTGLYALQNTFGTNQNKSICFKKMAMGIGACGVAWNIAEQYKTLKNQPKKLF